MLADANEHPSSPVHLTFERGRIVKAESADRAIVSRFNQWLDGVAGDTGRYGPVHFNIGLNPRARLTEHQEFEKVRGTVVMGIGDSRLLNRMGPVGQGLEPVISDVHWDLIVMRPTLALDGNVICRNGYMPEFTA